MQVSRLLSFKGPCYVSYVRGLVIFLVTIMAANTFAIVVVAIETSRRGVCRKSCCFKSFPVKLFKRCTFVVYLN